MVAIITRSDNILRASSLRGIFGLVKARYQGGELFLA